MDYSSGVFDEFLGKADFEECLGKAGKWLANGREIEYFAELMVTIFLNAKLNFDEGLMVLVLTKLKVKGCSANRFDEKRPKGLRI